MINRKHDQAQQRRAHTDRIDGRLQQHSTRIYRSNLIRIRTVAIYIDAAAVAQSVCSSGHKRRRARTAIRQSQGLLVLVLIPERPKMRVPLGESEFAQQSLTRANQTAKLCEQTDILDHFGRPDVITTLLGCHQIRVPSFQTSHSIAYSNFATFSMLIKSSCRVLSSTKTKRHQCLRFRLAQYQAPN